VSYNFVWFECQFGDGFSTSQNLLDIGDELTCIKVDACNINDECDCASGLPCQLDLGETVVHADIDQFPNECVATAAGLSRPAPSSPSAPVNPTSSSGVVVTARFRASWSLFADDVLAATRCGVDSTVAIVKCLQSNITLLETAASVTCSSGNSAATSSTNNNGVLNCIDSEATFGIDYTSFVEYVRCTRYLCFFFLLTTMVWLEMVSSTPDTGMHRGGTQCPGDRNPIGPDHRHVQ
jgi:hypothetical protein